MSVVFNSLMINLSIPISKLFSTFEGLEAFIPSINDSLKGHDRPIGRNISCDKRAMSSRFVMSEEFQNGTERITACIKHDVVVIPVQHIGTGYISQPRMEHIILEPMLLGYSLHVVKVSSIAHNQILHSPLSGSLMSPCIELLHHI